MAASIRASAIANLAYRGLCRTFGKHQAAWSGQKVFSLNYLQASQWRNFSTVLCSPSNPLSNQMKSVVVCHGHSRSFPLVQQRSVVTFSKRRGKKKTVKAVAKRFKRTGSGKLKYWKSGKNHKMYRKSKRSRRELRKPCYVTKTQLKTLNKMLAGL